MEVGNIKTFNFSNIQDVKKKSSSEDSASGFMDAMSSFGNMVYESQKKSSQEVDKAAKTNPESLHDAMLTMEEADISLKYMVSVRNKLLDAYKEISRMAG